MSDLIKREDAIKQINSLWKEFYKTKEWDDYDFEHNTGFCSGLITAMNSIKTLPSAEITHDDVMQYCNSRLLVLATVEFIKHQYRIGFEDGKASADRPTWIPCSERLPRAKYGESENVLASCESGHIHLLYFDGGNWCYPTGEAYEHNFDPVIAWMPLPEPWKGADDE